MTEKTNSNPVGFYESAYWNSQKGRNTLDIRKITALIGLIFPNSTPTPFIERNSSQDGWVFTWGNDPYCSLIIETGPGELSIYAMTADANNLVETLEFDFYHSFYFPYLDESGNEAFNSLAEDEDSKPLTVEALDSAIADAREWATEHEELLRSRDTREELHSYFSLS